MAVADLHVHTTRSDGALDPGAVPDAARRAGLDAVALTDHDRFHPDLAPVAERGGVTVIGGIELRVESEAGRVDLLGYAVDPTGALRRAVDRLQRDRVERAAAIVDAVEDRLGVDLDVEPAEGVGRPHIARAVERSPAPYDYAGAFEHLIGDDGPCYVPRDVPDFERGRELLSGACAVVGLAHPLRYDDPAAALGLAPALDAVERWYPYEGDPDPAPVERAIAEHGLLATGGSDAHDGRLGRAGPDRGAYDRFRRRLSEP